MKILTTCTAILFFTLALNAQDIIWQKSIGGDDDDELHVIISTSDGGYLLAAATSSGIGFDKSEAGQGNIDYWVIKLDAEGNTEWEHAYGGTEDDIPYATVQTPDGGYVIGGSSNSDPSGNKTQISRGNEDYWLIKIDAMGIPVWNKTIGGDDYDILYSIENTWDGGFMITGESTSSISGEKTVSPCYPVPYPDYWYMKLDGTGNIVWQNRMGGVISDTYNILFRTIDNNLMLAGTSDSDMWGCLKMADGKGYNDYWINLLDSTGYEIWEKDFGGDYADNFSDMIQTYDHGYLIAGYSHSNPEYDKDEGVIGGVGGNYMFDYWVLKLNNNGDEKWQHTLGGDKAEILKKVKQTVEGGFLLGGYSNSDAGYDKSQDSYGDNDYWLLKLDLFGNVEWDKTIGGSLSDMMNDVILTNDNNYLLAGTSSSGISGNKTSDNKGGSDIWLVKLSSGVNLVTGKVYIDLDGDEIPDPLETPLQYKLVKDDLSGVVTFSKSDGNYALAIPDTGSVLVKTPSLNYYDKLPTAHPVFFETMGMLEEDAHFAFQTAVTVKDLAVNIITVSAFRPGFTAQYEMICMNHGTTSQPTLVTFYPDTHVTFEGSDIEPVYITPDSIGWDLGITKPYIDNSFRIYVHVDEDAVIGTQTISYAQIGTFAGDADLIDNFDSTKIHVTGAFDPNQILVSRDIIFTNELAEHPALIYTIDFQNTGNDTAFFVRVVNHIPDGLIIDSMHIIALSHEAGNIILDADNNFTVDFLNILLPDKDVNEPASHGYIVYAINVSDTLNAGDILNSDAEIYFDYNDPVFTNTAQTEITIEDPLISFYPEFEFDIFPNPATDKVQLVINKNPGNAQVIISDMLGRKLKSVLFTGDLSTIDCNNLAGGIYLVSLLINQEVAAEKKLVISR